MQAPFEQTRRFTVGDANRMLPLISRIVADIVAVSEEIDERQFELDLLSVRDLRTSSAERWDRMQEEIERAEDRMDEYVTELADLGVELQDAALGEVDFPTQIDGTAAYLCWRLGEPEVAFWHYEDAGFNERLSLMTAAALEDGSSPQSSDR